jgi:hypothetical protein
LCQNGGYYKLNSPDYNYWRPKEFDSKEEALLGKNTGYEVEIKEVY